MVEHSEADSPTPVTAAAPAKTRDQAGSFAGRELHGRFSLLEKVANGKRGDVYRAEDRFGFDGDLPGRKLGVKLLHASQAAAPGGLRRFKRSFHVAQSLSHPNVLRVFEVDFDRATDSHYMTMELLNGSSLRNILQQLGSQPIPRTEALRIIRGICVALMHMHSRGYVHGDVRPSNIFVTRRLDAVLTNFEHTVHRSTGMPEGNDAESVGRDDAGEENRAAYASPQIAEGQMPSNNDDVFSLACVCYELFSGRLPDNPPAPVPGLGRRHWNAIRKALNPKRRKRTRGVTAFARDMAVLTPRASDRGPLFWALAAANAVMLGGIALMSMLAPEAPESRSMPAIAPAMADGASFTLEADSYRVSEKRTAVRIKAVRSGNLERPSSIAWWTQDHTAEGGRDFVDLGRTTLQFLKGQAEQWIFVPLVADTLEEGEEAFHVYIGDPADGDALGAIWRTTVYIENE